MQGWIGHSGTRSFLSYLLINTLITHSYLKWSKMDFQVFVAIRNSSKRFIFHCLEDLWRPRYHNYQLNFTCIFICRPFMVDSLHWPQNQWLLYLPSWFIIIRLKWRNLDISPFYIFLFTYLWYSGLEDLEQDYIGFLLNDRNRELQSACSSLIL